MAAMALTEIASIGAKLTEDWLNENGYSHIEVDNWQAGFVDIKAKGSLENILVQVKTVQLPAERAPTSGTDKFALKELASRLERIPYTASIVIDDNKNLVGEIVWERVH